MKTLIHGGTIVTEGRTFQGSIVIENDVIAEINEGSDIPRGGYDTVVDANFYVVHNAVLVIYEKMGK